MTTSDTNHAARPREPVRLTRRGRLLLVLATVGALLFAFWLGTWRAGMAATSADAGPAGQTVVLEPGETLWEIAERRSPGADPRITVHRIMELNGLADVSVDAGERLRVPARD